MTVAEALSAIRRVGTVEEYAGNLRLRFPETAAFELQPAIDTLRAGKAEALALLSDPDPAELARASAVLNRAGVHIRSLEGGATFGVWSDLDGPEVRAPFRTFGSDGPPVRYLDGASIAWAQWKAAALNRLFQEQGVTGEPGRITAATVRHGERNAIGES